MSLIWELTTEKAQYLVKVLAKGWFALTKFVGNIRSVLSNLNRKKIPTKCNIKALAAENKPSLVLGLK